MRHRLLRSTALVLSGVVAAGLIAITPASAENAAITAAEAKLAAIQEESSRIDAAFAQSQVDYEEAAEQLAQVNSDMTKQQSKLKTLKASLSQLAVLQYQTNTVGITTRLLAGSDEANFLNSLATLNSVSMRTSDNVQAVQLEQAKLDRMKRDAEKHNATMKEQQAKQAALVKEYDEKEAEAKRVVDRLKAEERQRLLQIQREREASATRAVSQAPSTTKALHSSFGSGQPGSDRALAAVNYAKSQVGKSYLFGSAGPSRYDCSGLTTAAFRSVGISLPRTSMAQFRVGTPVAKSDLRPGDLLFFYRGITHVGIYAGNGVMVHSSPSGRGVHYSNLATYPAYQGARRVA